MAQCYLSKIVQTVISEVRYIFASISCVFVLYNLQTTQLMKHGNRVLSDETAGLHSVNNVAASRKQCVPCFSSYAIMFGLEEDAHRYGF